MKINRYSRGSVSIVVLLACVVLSGAVQALILFVARRN